MKTITYAVGVFLSFGAISTYAETLTKTFKAGQIKSLKLNNSHGSVTIEGKTSPEAKVEVTKIKWSKNCALEIRQDGGVIDASVTKKSVSSPLMSNDCQVNFHVVVPSKIDLIAENGSGNINISNINGCLEIVLGSGDLTMQKVDSEKIKCQLGSGDLSIDGIIRSVDIKVGSGDINLVYRKVPTTGAVTIKSGSGNANISLPAESKIRVDFNAGSGKLACELDQLQNAPYAIFMNAGSGDLRIKKL